MIPLGSDSSPRLVIGHNVAYDRVRVGDEYRCSTVQYSTVQCCTVQCSTGCAQDGVQRDQEWSFYDCIWWGLMTLTTVGYHQQPKWVRHFLLRVVTTS